MFPSKLTHGAANLFRKIQNAQSSKLLPSRLFSSKENKKNAPSHKFRLAKQPDFDKVITFMERTFFKSEPSIVNLGLSDKPMPEVILCNVHDELHQGLSIVAVESNNEIIGVSLNAISDPSSACKTLENAKRLADHSESFAELLRFYAHLAQAPDIWEKYCVSRTFDCCNLAVDPQHGGKGIGRQLIFESWHLARDRGEFLFRIDATSTFTAKAVEKLGFECIYKLPFKDYKRNGKEIFTCIKEPHTVVQVYIDKVMLNKEMLKRPKLLEPEQC